MDTDKKKLLADFSHRALQRLRDKKIPKRQTLHIPSMDMDLTIRSLDYGEIMECMTLEDNGDIKRSDKYSIYLAAVEPSLRDTAKEVMAMEAELPPEDRELKEPLDIVNMFDLSEITQISTAIMELSGAMNGKVTVVEDLKSNCPGRRCISAPLLHPEGMEGGGVSKPGLGVQAFLSGIYAGRLGRTRKNVLT
ncbi:hypothetical protein M5E87_00055 [Flavonifractor plautii]|nr:hypothetical protein M5E87_00055 [Flavonifractor plautii]